MSLILVRTYLFYFNSSIPIQFLCETMSDDQNLMQRQKIGATIPDNRKAYDKAQEFDISILQGYKYEKNIENIGRLECQKACTAIRHSRSLYGNIIPHTN